MNLKSPFPRTEDRSPAAGAGSIWVSLLGRLFLIADRRPFFVAAARDKPTARPDVSERAYLLTVPFQVTVKSLSAERPVDAGAAEVRYRHDLSMVPSEAHRMGYCH